jgi:hypothetical protein
MGRDGPPEDRGSCLALHQQSCAAEIRTPGDASEATPVSVVASGTSPQPHVPAVSPPIDASTIPSRDDSVLPSRDEQSSSPQPHVPAAEPSLSEAVGHPRKRRRCVEVQAAAMETISSIRVQTERAELRATTLEEENACLRDKLAESELQLSVVRGERDKLQQKMDELLEWTRTQLNSAVKLATDVLTASAAMLKKRRQTPVTVKEFKRVVDSKFGKKVSRVQAFTNLDMAELLYRNMAEPPSDLQQHGIEGQECSITDCGTPLRFATGHCDHHIDSLFGLAVRWSTNRNAGLGLFATREIPPDTDFVYEGPRGKRDELWTKGEKTDGYQLGYQLEIDSKTGVVVDGGFMTNGCPARYINHTTDPFRLNMVFKVIQEKRIIRAVVRSTRTIHYGEELMVDYGGEFSREFKAIDSAPWHYPRSFPQTGP